MSHDYRTPLIWTQGTRVAHGIASVSLFPGEWQRIGYTASMVGAVIPARVRLTVGSITAGTMQVTASPDFVFTVMGIINENCTGLAQIVGPV